MQRKLSGEPAVFDTKAAFWIAKGEEDVWVSPYAADWRKIYMERVRQIAAKNAETDFNAPDSSWATGFLRSLHLSGKVEVTSSRNLVAHVATIGTRQFTFLANFDGPKTGELATPRTQHDIQITLQAPAGTQLHILPFPGVESMISGKQQAGQMRFTLPSVERDAIAWIT